MIKMQHALWLPMVGVTLLSVEAIVNAMPVRVERWLELASMSGQVRVMYRDRPQLAKVGDRLQAVGDGVITGKKAVATLAVDTGIGTVSIGQQTRLRIRALTAAPSGGRITQLEVQGGQARLKVRPFTNPDSRLEIITPAGITGVRGTDFGVSVQPSGKSAAATLEGKVVITAQGQAVAVDAGFQSFTIPGEPPSPPVPITDDTNLTFKLVKTFAGHIRRVRLEGKVDPVNAVFVGDQPIDSDRDGRFSVLLPAPNFPRYRVTVVTPLGKTQEHELALR
jgi:FecR protein